MPPKHPPGPPMTLGNMREPPCRGPSLKSAFGAQQKCANRQNRLTLSRMTRTGRRIPEADNSLSA